MGYLTERKGNMVQHRGHTIERTLNGYVATIYLTNEGRFYMVKAETVIGVRQAIDNAIEKDANRGR